MIRQIERTGNFLEVIKSRDILRISRLSSVMKHHHP